MKLLLIQGANMEYLGRRQPELYGTTSAKELDAILRRRARELDVTLDILYTNTEGEAVSAIYFPEGSKLGRLGFHDSGEVHLDAEGPDSPETFSGDSIDVGALAEEFFGLAIDPYPRKEGVAIDEIGAKESEGEHLGPMAEKLKNLTQKS